MVPPDAATMNVDDGPMVAPDARMSYVVPEPTPPCRPPLGQKKCSALAVMYGLKLKSGSQLAVSQCELLIHLMYVPSSVAGMAKSSWPLSTMFGLPTGSVHAIATYMCTSGDWPP